MKSLDKNNGDVRKISKYVTLSLGNELYGIEVTRTREIIARYNIVPLPKTPEFIEGIISLRGDIIPIIDLRKRFGLPHMVRDMDTRIIVVEMTEFTIGIEVDKVHEVLRIQDDAIEPPPPLVAGLKADYLQGVAEVNGKLTAILNLDEIFSSTEKVILSGMDQDASSDAESVQPPHVAQPSVSMSDKNSSSHKVSDDGTLEHAGRAYFVGLNYKGRSVDVTESGGRLSVSAGGERIKEFEV